MKRTVTIKLDTPLVTHDGPLKHIVLREPSYSEYLELGDPFTVAGSRDGQAFMVENQEAIRGYIKLCLVEPKDPALLEQATALVARDVKEGVLSFFRPADPAGEVSATLATNSSSVDSGSGPVK
jgi:hypothetical protein